MNYNSDTSTWNEKDWEEYLLYIAWEAYLLDHDPEWQKYENNHFWDEDIRSDIEKFRQD